MESREQGEPEGTNLASTVDSSRGHLGEDWPLDGTLDGVCYRDTRCSCERGAGRLTDMLAHRILVGIPGTLGAGSVSHGKLRGRPNELKRLRAYPKSKSELTRRLLAIFVVKKYIYVEE